nr:MAG TPA: hypothetical protein [Inoviridae sp.]
MIFYVFKIKNNYLIIFLIILLQYLSYCFVRPVNA